MQRLFTSLNPRLQSVQTSLALQSEHWLGHNSQLPLEL